MTFLQGFTKRYHRSLLKVMLKIGASTTQPLVRSEYAHLVCGYTTAQHLLLDLDGAHSLTKSILLVKMIQKEFPFVGDCLIAQSSETKFHAVFDNRCSWNDIIHVTETLAALGVLNRYYMIVRRFRRDLTLRVSSVDRGIRQSEEPLPIAIVLTDSLLKGEVLLEQFVKPYTMFNRFSGISDYLTFLSVFRSLSGVRVLLH